MLKIKKKKKKAHTQKVWVWLLEHAVHYTQINLQIAMFLRDVLSN